MTCILSVSDPLPLHVCIIKSGVLATLFHLFIILYLLGLYSNIHLRPSQGELLLKTLNSLVRGREAQESARRLVGKRRLDRTEMVNTCISRDIYL